MQTTWRERNQQTRIKSAKDALEKNPEYVCSAATALSEMHLFVCLHSSLKNWLIWIWLKSLYITLDTSFIDEVAVASFPVDFSPIIITFGGLMKQVLKTWCCHLKIACWRIILIIMLNGTVLTHRCTGVNTMSVFVTWVQLYYFYSATVLGGSVAEWLACWTQVQKGLGSNYSCGAVG